MYQISIGHSLILGYKFIMYNCRLFFSSNYLYLDLYMTFYCISGVSNIFFYIYKTLTCINFLIFHFMRMICLSFHWSLTNHYFVLLLENKKNCCSIIVWTAKLFYPNKSISLWLSYFYVKVQTNALQSNMFFFLVFFSPRKRKNV